LRLEILAGPVCDICEEVEEEGRRTIER